MTALKVTLILDEGNAELGYLTGGRASIAPSARLPGPADNLIVGQAPVTADFTADGPPQVELVGTDQVGPQPDGWLYTITYYWVPGSPKPWSFYLRYADGPVQRLSQLAAVPVAQPGQQYVPWPDTPPQDGQVLGWDGSRTGWVDQPGGGSPQPAGYVRFTVTGASFAPQVTLANGSAATVTWTVEEGWPSQTGLAPAFSFGLAGARHVRMHVTSSGQDALGDVSAINLGFTNTLDEGDYSPSSSWNYASQQVTAVEGVSACTGLTMFLATQTPLTGPLDFTGCSALTNIELYGSDVTAVNVTGCAGLLRLVTEQDNVTTADLGPVAAGLREFRSAAQQGAHLSLAPLPADLADLYHFCVRDQAVTGMPALSHLPAVKELWIWNTSQSGALAPVSTSMTNLQAYSNAYTSADLAGLFVTGSTAYLDLHANQLAAIDLTGDVALGFIDLHDNLLPQSQVDGVLATVNGFGTSNGTLNLGGTGNAAPSSAGTAAVTSLQGRGWTVTVAGGGGGGGGGFTHQDTGFNSAGSGLSLAVTLSGTISAGDLLCVFVETGGGTPSVSDTAGNTWAAGAASDQVFYCLSAKATAGTVITATVGSGFVHQMIADRFTPPGSVSFGAAAETGSSGTIGLNYNGTGCGDLGTVPAHALAWGAFTADDTSADQSYTPGFQTGTTAPADMIGSQFNGAHGTGLSVYVLDTAAEDATLTWYGTGTGAIGHAGSAYFTSP